MINLFPHDLDMLNSYDLHVDFSAWKFKDSKREKKIVAYQCSKDEDQSAKISSVSQFLVKIFFQVKKPLLGEIK